MPQSLETRVAFDALIMTVVAPELKRRGYRKTGLRWSRTRDKVKTTISVQRDSQAHRLDAVEFTFNFDSRTSDVHLSGRIGALMPEPSDVWWRVHSGLLGRSPTLPRLEPELVEHEIADAVGRVADAIDTLHSSADVHRFAEQHAALLQLGLLRVS